VTGHVIPFNPLDKKNLGASVAEALLARPVLPLGDLPEFNGAGIYAIYYIGAFKEYGPLATRNRDGKAIPAGGRKGASLTTVTATKALYGRLAEHANSVAEATNLELSDFFCRFLVVDDIWIPLGESLLITKFAPVWNALIDGFGNHDPGSGRYNGMRPRWDVIHPGRAWALKCRERPESASDIRREIATYLRTVTLPTDSAIIQPNASQPFEPKD
jgi:hypothetical protein